MMKNRIAEWRKARGLSVNRLGALLNSTSSQIVKLERGDRKLSSDWLIRIARVLGVEPQDLLVFEPVEQNSENDCKKLFSAAPAHVFINSPKGALLPIYGAGRRSGVYSFAGAPMDYMPRPALLEHAPEAYACHVTTNELAPRYRLGEVIMVQPGRPVAPNDYVIIRLADGTGIARLLVGLDADGAALVATHQPDATSRIGASEIARIDLIVMASLGR